MGSEMDTVSQELKQKHEKELEEEYMRVVEKTAAREAAREAAKESEISEYKLLYEEIKAKNSDRKSEKTDADADKIPKGMKNI